MPIFESSISFYSSVKNSFKPLSVIYQGIHSLFSEPKESVYVKSSKNEEYQQFDEWRSSLIRYLVLIEKYILKDIRPTLLHKMIVFEQNHMFKHMPSPFFYYEYFKILEQNLPSDTPVVFSYILRDARVRLREKLIKQPQLALDYFYKDILFQLIRLSGKKTNVKRFKQMMHYYKKLVPEEIYTSVSNYVKEFLKSYTNDDPTQIDTNELPYIQLQEKIDSIFEEYNLPVVKQVEKKLTTKAKEHPQLTVLAMLSLLAGSWYALSAKENGHYGLQPFNLTNSNLDPLLLNSMLHYFSWQYTRDVKSAASSHAAISMMVSMLSLMHESQAFILNNYEHSIFKNTEEPITFYNVYNWTNGDVGYATSIQPTSSGYIMLGVTFTSDYTFLIKLTNSGDIEWKKTVISKYFSGWAVREISDGTYITIGETYSFGVEQRVAIQNWDNSGVLIWSRMFDWGYQGRAVAIQASIDDGFFVCGYIFDENDHLKTFIAKWDSDKTLTWVKTIDLGVDNYASFLQQASNGDIIVIGGVALNNKNDTDCFISVFDAYGNPTWTEVLGTNNDDNGRFILPIDNGYIATGVAGDDNFLIKLTNQSIEWAKKLTTDDTLVTVQETFDNNFITVGSFLNNSTKTTQPTLLQWTQNGTVFSAKFVNTSADTSVFKIIRKTPNGGFIIAGINAGKGWYDTMLVKLDSQAELIDCPLFFEMPLPQAIPIQFQSFPMNITVQTIIVNLSNIQISALDAAVELIRMCPNYTDDNNTTTNKWVVIGLGIAAGAIIIGFLTLMSFCLLRKQNRFISSLAPHSQTIDQFEYIREFDFNDIQIGVRLGGGGYGEVFKGSLGRIYPEVAIKKLHAGEAKQEDAAKAELMREIRLMRALEHPNIVSLYGYAIKHDVVDEYYIIMEFIPNRSLAEAVFEEISENEYRRITSLTWRQRFEIAVGIARGLALLHPHIIHSDLKSYNILLDENFRPKICDFGLAKILNKLGHNIISSGKSVADGRYVAPELLGIGVEPGQVFKPDEKTDMYSYGKILEDLVEARFRAGEREQTSNDNNQEATSNTNLITQQEQLYGQKMSELMRWCTLFHDERPTATDALVFLEDRTNEEGSIKETDSLLTSPKA